MYEFLVKTKRVMNYVLSRLCTVLLVVMTLLVLWQVFTRYVLNDPASFTEELVRYFLIWTGFIGAAYAFSTREHMALTFIRDKFDDKPRRTITILVDSIILITVFSVLVVGGLKLAIAASMEYSALLGVPRSLVYSMAPISGVFIIIIQIINIYEDITGKSLSEKADDNSLPRSGEQSMSIALTAVVLFAVFFTMLALSVPISVSILISSVVTGLATLGWDQISFIAIQKMNSGVESFSLLAVPLFILAGNIMNNGGIARRMINFAKLFCGFIPGSLAQTNVLGNMLFGSLAGSAVAAASAMGGSISPIQKEEKYDMAFATAVNIASAPTGLLIPPTSAFIVYSTVVGGVSISALFMAGYVPGILMGLGVMAVAYFYARAHKYATTGIVPAKVALKVTLDALPSFALIVIVIGGIVCGVFTATEGAAVCVIYCLFLSVLYRSINYKTFMKILVDSACTSGIILFLISTSSAMAWVMAYSGIPSAIAEALLAISDNKYVIFFLINIILLVIGMFLDITPAILIFTPIFLPICVSLGMDPVHFGVVLIFNMCIGSMTPPVGSVLFVGCGITKMSIERVSAMLLPYFIVLICILLLLTYVPALSLAIPQALGLMQQQNKVVYQWQ